jgi:hypothetical protein
MKNSGELRVYMTGGNLGPVRTIKHVDGTHTTLVPSEKAWFALRNGETAYLSTLPHDSCTANAVAVDGVLGLKLTASASIHGIGRQSATQFVVAE